MKTGSSGQLLLDIGLVLGFILIAGVFVAAEIALISLRESQVRQLESTGKRGARVADLAKNPNRFLAAAQVGVTFCSFLSAALGADRIGTDFLIPQLEKWHVSHGLATFLSLVGLTTIIAYISLVFGELVPKRLALYRTEKIALAAAPMIDRIARIFAPTIWILSKSTNTVVKLFGLKPEEVRGQISESELVDLVTGHNALTVEERDILEDVFNAGDLSLHEIMVPRIEVDFLDVALTVSEAKKFAIETAHSRYPVTRGSSDEVIGFLHIRDLLKLTEGDGTKTVLEYMRPIVYLPGTKGVLPALTEMRSKRSHIAVVLDEYGGTDGIVTLEDLVECFVGDIHDEYDAVIGEVTAQTKVGDFEVDALISLEDLYDQTEIALPEGPYETAGGYVMHSLGRIPEPHDVVESPGIKVTVLTVEGKRAGQLLISRTQWKDKGHESSE
jgi:putative hemolysin